MKCEEQTHETGIDQNDNLLCVREKGRDLPLSYDKHFLTIDSASQNQINMPQLHNDNGPI